MYRKKVLFITVMFLLLSFSVSASDNGKGILEKYGIQENYIVREGLSERLIEPVDKIKESKSFFSFEESDSKVKFRVVVDEKKIYFAFVNETETGYPPNNGGNYIIRRDKKTGVFDNILIVLRKETIIPGEPTSYISISPQGSISVMDVYLLGRLYYKSILIPHPIETLITMPFSLIIDVSKNVVDWDVLFFQGNRSGDKRIEQIISEIAAVKSEIRKNDDGALNENGIFVFIEDEYIQKGPGGYNCSGFAKWLIDGFYKPITGTLTSIKELKKRHPDARGTRWSKNFEEDKDTYFGLDWTRNLAVILEKARRGSDSVDYEEMDVRKIFRFSYVEDKGFPVADSRMLLYLLALKNPGVFYLGTINGFYPANPVYAQYYHVAAFFPYFDSNGEFHIIVFDQHAETTIDSIIDMYRNEYIHFVSVGTDSSFLPVHK